MVPRHRPVRRARAPGLGEEVQAVCAALASLPPARTLDVACGTAFLTQHLRGFVVGIDQSPKMVAIAQSRLPDGLAMVGEAFALPFAAGAFDRVLAGHFYGHLEPAEREAFVAEAARVAPELLIVDSALRPGEEPERWQERELNDGSRHAVYKRWFTPDSLTTELGGETETLHAGDWFVVARSQPR